MTSLSSLDRVAIAKAEPAVQRAAHWFWWIAGLSVINTAILAFGGDIHFVVGLGVTQILDVAFRQIIAVALVLDVFVVGFFVLMGVFAARGHLWAFVIGAICYLVDGAIFAYFGDWLPVAFHAYVLFCLFKGWNHLRESLRAAREQPEAPPVPDITVPPPLA
ncbi:MAG TPA: hypothetical protein VHD32_12910 [Candidatus Didemnitutus sp.]|nr:hypothetical protein [Candidatus Didemnitutus sp.]